MLRVLDLFSGIGGFSRGLELAGGFETVGFCEIDPFCRDVLAKHWPGVPIHDDIRTLDATRTERIDILAGGFPCQDISHAGPRTGLAGSRSGLWRDMVRTVCLVRPRTVLVENVAALLGRGLDRVLGDLAEVGYDAEWHCIPAAAVGAPHQRDRLWIIADAECDRVEAWGRNARGNQSNRTDAGRVSAPGRAQAIPASCDQGRLAIGPADADGEGGLQPPGLISEIGGWAYDCSAPSPGWETPWPEVLSSIQGMDDGVSDRLDAAGIDATGNAVLPQIVEMIGRAVRGGAAKALRHQDGGA